MIRPRCSPSAGSPARRRRCKPALRWLSVAGICVCLCTMWPRSMAGQDPLSPAPLSPAPLSPAQSAPDPSAPASPADATPVDFDREVLPLLQASCLACHNESDAASELVLESVESIRKGGSSGPIINTDAPDESQLLRVAAHLDEPVMPPLDNDVQAERLTEAELDVIRRWIGQGARASADSGSAAIEWTAINPALVAVYALDLDWHGRFVAAGRGNRVLIHDRRLPNAAQSLIDPELSHLAREPHAGVAHRDFVHALAFHPDGNRLATAGYQIVKLWERQPGEPVPVEDPVLPAAERPGAPGIPLVLDPSGRTVTLQDGPLIRIEQIPTDDQPPQMVAEIPLDGARFLRADGDGVLAVAGDRTLVRLAAADGQESWRLEAAGEGPVADVVSSPDVDRLMVRSADGSLRLYQRSDRSEVAELRRGVTRQLAIPPAEAQKSARELRLKHLQSVESARVEELSKQKSTHENAVKAHVEASTARDAAQQALTEAETATAAARKALEEAPDDDQRKAVVEAAEKAENEKRAAYTAAEDKAELLARDADLALRAVQRTEAELEQTRAAVAVAEADLTHAVESLQALQQEPADAPKPLAGGGFLFGGQHVAACDVGGRLTLWSSTDGTPVDAYALVEPDDSGSAVTTARFDGSDHVTLQWEDGRAARVSADLKWQLSARLQTDAEGSVVFPERIYSLAFSPDGSLLAAGGGEASRSGMIAFWNTDDATLHRVLPDVHSDVVYDLEFSPDGRLLASASADKFARVFDVASAERVQELEGHTNQVLGVTWNVAQNRIATAGADNVIKVWNTDSGLQERTISTYSKQVSSVEFTDNQQTLLSCSGDQRVFLHDAANGKPVRELPRNPDYVHRAVASGRGDLIAAGCEDGHVRIWTSADGKPVADLPPVPESPAP